MNPMILGAAAGTALAFAALAFGFWGFVLVALFMAIGTVIGRVATGKVDIRGIIDAFTGRRTSS